MLHILKHYNHWFILLSVVASIIFGICTPDFFSEISFLGDLFLNLLKLFALPLICSSLMTSLGSLGNNLSEFKPLVKNTLLYMITSEIMAVTIALCLFNLFSPGEGVDAHLILNNQVYKTPEVQSLHVSTFLLSIFPSNIFTSLAHFDIFPIVIFSIMLSIGCALIGDKSTPIIQLATAVRDATQVCLHGVMLFSPIGIFALIGHGIAQSTLHGHLIDNLLSLLSFVSLFIIGLILHGLWQLILVVILTKQKSLTLLQKSIPVFSTAFATSSSIATLPYAMETADLLQSKPQVTRFMLPLCASINIGGMMMYEIAAVLFFSQVLGISLPLSYQCFIAIICILGGMAEGGIPETSMVSLVMIFNMVNIPLAAISILLPLDRILDRFRTMVNIFGNMCGTIITSYLVEKKMMASSPSESRIDNVNVPQS